ncbi:hypothetical protein ELI43_06825 [Rhizobium leguminosarum]|uniref:hypothetical protein n=1 Tax=Rhizobium leguminosarum TaxID=384 RepID=UPI001030EAEE|nr:hypothetical protein [Rhizobium leguminosarum]TAU52543.1 hypothetical protein ELI43_06825 [Rhizobium leguminosarum]
MSNEDFFEHPILRIRAKEVAPHPGRIETETDSSVFPPGFVLLFEAETGRPLSLFNHFNKEVAVAGRSDPEKWKKTQKSYADDGANYATFLHYRGKSLETGKFSDLKAYAQVMGTSLSTETGRKFATSTRRRRIGTIVGFYEWTFEKGYLPRVLPPRSGKLPAGLRFKAESPKADKAVRALMPGKPRPDEKVNLVPLAVVARVLKQLGPKVEQRVPHGPPSRDRLVAESALATSARLVSLVSIDVLDVLNAERLIDPQDANQLLVIRVQPKGDGPPKILVPQSLLIKWLKYYRGERAEICRKAIERHGPARRISTKLFLNHMTANGRDLGGAASEDTLSRAFTAAILEIGHTTLESRAVLDEFGKPQVNRSGHIIWNEVEVAANTFHDLRHTYVVMTYHAMKRAGHRNPWKVISIALGHKLMSTTIDTYGKHVEVDESGLSQAVDDFLSNLDET